jgi:2-iminobutanoate/2-iminopropanoate deaminase
MKLVIPFIAVILLSTALTTGIGAKKGENPVNQISLQTPKASDSVEYLTSRETTSLNLPFSEAVRVGNMLYLSGQLGNIKSTKKLVGGGIKAETKQAMENIKRILERNGSSLNQVVKCQVMLADMKDWSAMNEVYVTYFPKDKLPARSALGANGLALNARVEIECMATVNN